MPTSPTNNNSLEVDSSVTLRLVIFGFLGLIPLANLFINIIDMTVKSSYLSDLKEGFSFYDFVSNITEFKCIEGTEGYIFLSMFIMLLAGIKLLAASINAFLWCKKSKKLKKAYKGLYKWSRVFGIASLVAAGVNYYGHKTALEEDLVGYLLEDLIEFSIPVPFAALSIVAIVIGVVINVYCKKDEDKLTL